MKFGKYLYRYILLPVIFFSALVGVALLKPVSGVEAKTLKSVERIKQYKNEYFNNLQLSNDEIAYLNYLMGKQERTNELVVLQKEDKFKDVHVEIKKYFARLNCLEILRNPTFANYKEFVKAQNTRLKYQDFLALANYFRKLSAKDIELLKKSIMLQALTLSQPLIDQVTIVPCKPLENQDSSDRKIKEKES